MKQSPEQLFLNGYNLHPELTEGMYQKYQGNAPSNVCVAFDVPVSRYETYCGTFGSGWSREDATSNDLFDEGWIICGFDVAGPILQVSGLFSFEFAAAQKTRLDHVIGSSLNQFGLFGQVGVADRCASVLNELISEHGPFSTCGVWLTAK